MLKLLATDLDGTLRDGGRGIPSCNIDRLRQLGERDIERVVVTGRSLFHVRKVLDPDFPCDWLIHASGAGLLRWPDQLLWNHPGMQGADLAEAVAWLKQSKLPFSIHQPAPASHCCLWWRGELADAEGVDFDRRLELNLPHSQPLDGILPGSASFLLVIAPLGEDWPGRLSDRFPGFKLLHSTSPLSSQACWIELLPPELSKGWALASLAARLNLQAESCLALGNDFNDLDMLRWAGSAGVVAESPAALRAEFPVLGSCEKGLLAADAVRELLP